MTVDTTSLILSQERYVRKVANHYYQLTGIPFDDLFQEGMYGLCEAANRFDPSNGCKYFKYSSHYVYKYILDAVKRECRYNQNHSSLEYSTTDEEGKVHVFFRDSETAFSPIDYVCDADYTNLILNELRDFSQRDLEIAILTVGIGVDPLKPKVVAEQYGLCDQQIRNIKNRALSILRNSPEIRLIYLQNRNSRRLAS